MCIKKFVDCKDKGGYDPKDKCKQTCMTKVPPKPVKICIKRYVDCRKKGGYDPKDSCHQTCILKEEEKETYNHPYLQANGAIKIPQVEIDKLYTDIEFVFKKGKTAWSSYMRAHYKSYMKLNMALKKDKDNLDLQYKVKYMRTRYGWMKKAYYTFMKRDKQNNKEKYEAEKKKREAEEAKKADNEKEAFEKEEAILLDGIQQAVKSPNKEHAIKELLGKQSKNLKKAIAWAKKSAIEPNLSNRAKYMA